jgi:hypothetical protein
MELMLREILRARLAWVGRTAATVASLFEERAEPKMRKRERVR